MPDPSERRNHTRVNVSEEHTVRFHLGERSITGLTMTNLSAGGCCFKIPVTQSEGMIKGAQVSRLYLVHPRIPSTPLRATICWLMGRQPGRTEGVLLVGLEFTDPSPQFQETLDAYVQSLLG